MIDLDSDSDSPPRNKGKAKHREKERAPQQRAPDKREPVPMIDLDSDSDSDGAANANALDQKLPKRVRSISTPDNAVPAKQQRRGSISPGMRPQSVSVHVVSFAHTFSSAHDNKCASPPTPLPRNFERERRRIIQCPENANKIYTRLTEVIYVIDMSAKSLQNISEKASAPLDRVKRLYCERGDAKHHGADITALSIAFEDLDYEHRKLIRVLRACIKAEQESSGRKETLSLSLDMAYIGCDSQDDVELESDCDVKEVENPAKVRRIYTA
jgi:hypothetical protein